MSKKHSFPDSAKLLPLLLCYLSIRYGTRAMPVPTAVQEQCSSTLTTSQRSLFNIVWSCTSTTIICSWVSVHPNVPPRSKIWAFLRRISLMIWTIIAPELVLAWAVRQRSAARMVQREYNGRGWTEAHGHFLNMGGFTLVNRRLVEKSKKLDEVDLGPVSFHEFKKLVDDSEIEFPSITTAEIEDRSKGDFLSKSLAVIQTTWFLLQCAARIPQRLALTELELVTLALASLNAVTYYFWWNKPLQVQEPVKLFLKKTRNQREDAHNGSRKDLSVGEVVATIREFVQEFGKFVWRFLLNPCEFGALQAIVTIFFLPMFLIAICFTIFPIAVVSLLSILSIDDTSSQSGPHRIAARFLGRVRLTFTTFVHDYFKQRFREEWRQDVGGFLLRLFIVFPLLFVILIILILFIVPFFLVMPSLFNSCFDIMTTDTITPGALYVPLFYAPRTNSDRYSRMLVFAFFGVIFGGLHIIGWFFEFPTPSERELWRVTSIIITGIPVVVASIDFLIAQKLFSSRLPEMFLVFVMTILICIYVPTRLSLIAQAIALLRHLPPSAFVSVNWSKYLPHIFSS